MSWIGTLFQVIFTIPIFNALMGIYLLCGDLGLSVVLLTILVFVILLPVTLRQLRSAWAMRAMQPALEAARRQYPKDREAQSRAMMDVYRRYGVHPLGNIVSLLVQIPLFIGLANALSSFFQGGSLANFNSHLYPFVPHLSHVPSSNLAWFAFLHAGWSFPLGQPDPTFLLPLLTALATWWQVRLSPGLAVGRSKEEGMFQHQLMPVMVGITVFLFTFRAPAGLALYWGVFTALTALLQYMINRGVRVSAASAGQLAPGQQDQDQEVSGVTGAGNGEESPSQGAGAPETP